MIILSCLDKYKMKVGMITMDNKIYLPNGMQAVSAQYKSSPLIEYNGNPLIESLPKLENEKQIVRKLVSVPIYKEEEISLDSSIRLHILQRLYQLFQPLPKHIEIWNMINTLIRQGYIARNPFDKEYKRYVNETGKQIINRSFDINSNTSFRTTASCGLIIGFSGMGKTTTVNRVLNHIPQVVVHNYFDNQNFNQIQLSYLRLEAPHNSSLKALTLQFFMKIDEILGTDNFKRYVSRNLSVDAMLPLMGKVAQNIGLGLLVIDELQHLNRGGAHKIMNYFVNLINSFGVPIIFIGTPESYDFLQNEFRIARRVTGNGEVIWNNMDNDGEFELFLNGIWRYQWLKNKSRLNKELIDLIYEETQGISDLIIKLFINSQYTAIKSGKEEITLEIVKEVASKEFKLIKPMIDTVRSKNPYKTIKYNDLRRLNEEDYQPSIIKTNNYQERFKDNIVKSGNKENIEVEKNQIKSPSKKIRMESLEDDDLRFIINKGSTIDKNGYEILNEKGIIDCLSFLEVGDIG